ncbi:hypothetical protein INS49_008985 [Diaporthe citri]|uniref:uncharacterized protein n=1 Tax=Diaporthe citri TaxID=83186 RepID=UPI001C810A83|nr:uncharacterized protein INS49_008985 [Diaporthe citri]KAG6363882.1 hypothetical protein INS49_008985 [Diaporthe citri]
MAYRREMNALLAIPVSNRLFLLLVAVFPGWPDQQVDNFDNHCETNTVSPILGGTPGPRVPMPAPFHVECEED